MKTYSKISFPLFLSGSLFPNTLLIGALFSSILTWAEPQHSPSKIDIELNQAIVQVKGVVCSFCAYGTEKNLGRLSFLDKSQFGDDGVLLDIKTHRITLALLPGKPVDLPGIYNAIKKGGYDPVSVTLSVRGEVRQEGNLYLLTSIENGQIFSLKGKEIEQLVDQGPIQIVGFLDAAIIPDIQADQAVPIQLRETI